MNELKATVVGAVVLSVILTALGIIGWVAIALGLPLPIESSIVWPSYILVGIVTVFASLIAIGILFAIGSNFVCTLNPGRQSSSPTEEVIPISRRKEAVLATKRKKA